MFIYIRGFLITVILLFHYFGGICNSDSIVHPLSYSSRFHYGFIFTHTAVLHQFADRNPAGFEVDLMRLNNAEEDYIQCNCWSYSGVSLGFVNFGLPNILGNALTVNGFIEPVLLNYTLLKLNLRLGTGLAFLSKVYDAETNPTNQFFSSKLSFTLIGGLRFVVPINDQFRIEGSSWYNHISNGGIKQPNKGMNYPTFSLGLNYSPYREYFFDRNNMSFKTSQRNRKFFLRSFFSGKVQDETPEYPLVFCPISGFSGGYIHPFSTLSLISLSMGIERDGYLNESLRRDGREIQKGIVDLALGYGVNAGRFTFLLRMGLYIVAPVDQNDIIFQQYDLFYSINSRLETGVYLKAHRHVAEHMGISLFYSLFVQN
jgi:hypothetical protein